MDVPLILMYSFFALLNIKIFLSVGIISYFKKAYSEKSLKNLSQLLVNCFLPIYGVIEVARMATPSNLQIFWILILSVILSMIIGYYSAKIFQYFFKLDVRISSSFALLCCLPSIGTLPLVLGRAFCFPGGPLENDPQCSNILGYMMINYLVFQIGLFLIGFHLIAKDANYGYVLDDKMSLTWHILCEKIFKKNFFVLLIFRKYFKDKKSVDKAFEEFETNNKLIRNENEITYRFVCLDNDEAIVDNHNYMKELRKSQQMMPFFLESQKYIEKEEDNQKEEEESNDYLQNFIEPKRLEKEDDYVFSDIRRNSSIRMKPSIKFKFHDEKSMSQKKTEFNEIEEEFEENGEKEENQINNKKENKEETADENGKSRKSFDSKGNSIHESNSVHISEDENDPNKIHLENIVIKTSPSEEIIEPPELNNPVIKKISPLIIDEYTDLKKKKLKDRSSLVPSSIVPELNIRNYQSEFFRPKERTFEREHSIHFQISKRKQLAQSLAINAEQQRRIHQNLESFLLNRKSNIIISPDPKHEHDFYMPRESLINITISKEEREKKLREIQSQIFENQRLTTSRMPRYQVLFDTGISRYYQKMFRIIQQNLNPVYLDEFELEKSEIMKNIHDIPPKFPIARGIEINRINIKEVDAIWDDYLIAIKNLNNEFELHSCVMNEDLSLIINKIHSPAVVGTILGLVIGISGMRDILFSSNHYITNLVDGILILTKATVRFLYVSVGVSFVTIRGFSLNLPVSSNHMWIGMVVRFIIVPAFGLLWTWNGQNFMVELFKLH